MCCLVRRTGANNTIARATRLSALDRISELPGKLDTQIGELGMRISVASGCAWRGASDAPRTPGLCCSMIPLRRRC
jgi:hypothetical protein